MKSSLPDHQFRRRARLASDFSGRRGLVERHLQISRAADDHEQLTGTALRIIARQNRDLHRSDRQRKLRFSRSGKSASWKLVTMLPKRSMRQNLPGPGALSRCAWASERRAADNRRSACPCAQAERRPPGARPPARRCRGRETCGSPDAGNIVSFEISADLVLLRACKS